MIHRSIYCRNRMGSILIRAADGMGWWSHCAGILQTGEHVVEAKLFGGVVITPLEDVVRRSSHYELIDAEVPDALAGDTWALTTVGSPYDYLGALGSPWGRDWQADGAWYCSHHRETWLVKAGHPPRWRKGKRGATPNESYWVL